MAEGDLTLTRIVEAAARDRWQREETSSAVMGIAIRRLPANELVHHRRAISARRRRRFPPGSEQMSEMAQGLSQGANEQAASIEELSASVEELASTIRQNADNTKRPTPSRGGCTQNAEESAGR
jgi:methyl-accepting chemotaxis protein